MEWILTVGAKGTGLGIAIPSSYAKRMRIRKKDRAYLQERDDHLVIFFGKADRIKQKKEMRK
jgi:hypothetical protein